MGLILQVYQDSFLPDIVKIWNETMRQQHGFFPLTENDLLTHYSSSKRFKPEHLLIANNGTHNVGFIHFDIVDIQPYAKAGVISALAISPDYQLEGIGSTLLVEAIKILKHNKISFIDAGGAWPYSSFYATLIDGSEKAGINLKNKGARWLLNKYSFKEERESLTMQYQLKEHNMTTEQNWLVYNQSRQGKNTWLDDCFRNWKLYDHALISPSGKVLTRAIYGRMTGESNYLNKEKYTLFSVATPPAQQGRGLATTNLNLISNKLKTKGVDEIELHVYADNLPAIKLYNKIGFKETGRTVIMRCYN